VNTEARTSRQEKPIGFECGTSNLLTSATFPLKTDPKRDARSTGVD
jgi:hypothetical protein